MSWGRTRGTSGPGRPPPGQSRESGRRAVGHPPRPSASAAGAEPAEVALGRGGGGSPGNSGVCPSQCRSTLRGCDGRGRVGVHQHRPTCRGDEGQRGPLRRGRRAPLDVTGVGTVLKPDGRRSEQASDRAQDVHPCPHDERRRPRCTEEGDALRRVRPSRRVGPAARVGRARASGDVAWDRLQRVTTAGPGCS